MEQEQHFATLASLLSQYDPGDLLRLSNIIDEISQLKAFYDQDSICSRFVASILGFSTRNLRSEVDQDFSSSLGLAIDLLQKWKPDLSETSRTGIEEKMKLFCADVLEKKHSLIDKADGGTTPEKKAASTEETSTVKQTDNAFHRDETFAIFMAEAKERLIQAQDLLLQLEENPQEIESLSALFRVFHTIKGECGFLHLSNLGELTHRLENILDLLRTNKLLLDKKLVDFLLSGIDRCNGILQTLIDETRNTEIDAELATYLEAINAITGCIQPEIGKVLLEKGKLEEHEVHQILEQQRQEDFTKKFGEIAIDKNLISHNDLAQALVHQSQNTQTAKAPEVPQKPEQESAPENEIIKVRLNKVDFLVDMIGELTIALSQVAENSLAMAQVKKITRSLQFGSMELRTDTMQGLFGTAKRIIRDLAGSLKKDVRVQTEGDRLEIDRNLIKKLEEPLMHIVRNSLDHGIEASEERVKKGKPEFATVKISAVRHGSSIMITVADDGRGLDRDRILAKAIEQKLVRPEAAASLSDTQIYNFIFQPGFSTCEAVSKVSGRGVGMDIVRSMVAASRGSIKFNTKPGEGTTFVLSFPISTAIIEGLIVRAGDNALIVPVNSVIESLKISASGITKINSQAELVTVRGQSLPVLRLEKVLGIDQKVQNDLDIGILNNTGNPCAAPSTTNQMLIGLIVENTNHQRYFFVIDEIIAKREVVVKPLGPRFKNMQGITSGTVLGGGAIGFVLDVDQVIRLDVKDLHDSQPVAV